MERVNAYEPLHLKRRGVRSRPRQLLHRGEREGSATTSSKASLAKMQGVDEAVERDLDPGEQRPGRQAERSRSAASAYAVLSIIAEADKDDEPLIPVLPGLRQPGQTRGTTCGTPCTSTRSPLWDVLRRPNVRVDLPPILTRSVRLSKETVGHLLRPHEGSELEQPPTRGRSGLSRRRSKASSDSGEREEALGGDRRHGGRRRHAGGRRDERLRLRKGTGTPPFFFVAHHENQNGPDAAFRQHLVQRDPSVLGPSPPSNCFQTAGARGRRRSERVRSPVGVPLRLEAPLVARASGSRGPRPFRDRGGDFPPGRAPSTGATGSACPSSTSPGRSTTTFKSWAPYCGECAAKYRGPYQTDGPRRAGPTRAR